MGMQGMDRNGWEYKEWMRMNENGCRINK